LLPREHGRGEEVDGLKKYTKPAAKKVDFGTVLSVVA